MSVEYGAFTAIVIMCYFAGMICKSFGKEKLDRFIPVICGALGIVLGLVIFYTIPGFIPATNWAEAVVIGIVSGLAAVGVNQVGKQALKLKGGK